MGRQFAVPEITENVIGEPLPPVVPSCMTPSTPPPMRQGTGLQVTASGGKEGVGEGEGDAEVVGVGAGGGAGAEGVTAFEADEDAPVPATFVAATVKVYEVPFVRPLTVHDVDEVEQVAPPGLDVTVYDVIAAPPLLAGAVHVTVALALPADAVTPVGAPGTVLGVTALDAADAGPAPEPFVAVTVNVYDEPFVRPEMMHDSAVAGDGVQVAPPGLAVAV